MLDLHKTGSLHIVPQPFIDLYPQQMRYGPGQTRKDDDEAGLPVNAAILPTSFLSSGFKRRQQSQPESVIPAKPVQTPSSPLFGYNRIQIAGRRVRYQSWDFHLTLRKETGLRVYGVYFAGHSIISEAGLDETVTSYWGYSPFMRAMTSLESMYGVGAMSSELSPGIDCPKEAVYLPVRLVLSGESGPKVLKHGICLFDWLVQPPGGPLRRHFEFPGGRSEASGGSETTEHTNFAFGTPSRALVVRSVASIFNYDYVFDIVFHASGVIEFSVTPTGYIHVDTVPPNWFSNPSNQSWYEKSAFGFVSNTMPLYFVAHQHLFHYKLDIDLRSSRNFVKVINVDGPANYPVSPVSEPPTLWISSRIPRSELEARFHTQFEYPKQYLVCETQREEKQENPQCVGLINKGAVITLASHEHTRSYAWSRSVRMSFFSYHVVSNVLFIHALNRRHSK
ncbi:copper amine oxidase, enzyme domain protein [Opisthorchis viverrini]|uniref:Amine oxidase n=1 Tax=Opisthorchis viverrini TaxID=6198 RepID=A0A1S8WWY6_OPIVI|nr:copper amine oxidase, enzyme domain protein [Opisthorchis viverrini]